MFIGLILAVLIIIGYAMYVSNKYARKSEIEKLEQRISRLEEGKDDSSGETE
jgi:cell division protein FtsL